MIDTNCPIMSWNVRGLNSPAWRAVVNETAETHKLALLCLQETKIGEWSRSLVREVCGARLADCVVLPATGTRGGAAIFWDRSRVEVQSHTIGRFSITAKITLAASTTSFWMTTVYGPVDDGRKDDFLAELARTSPAPSDPWLINDDFNLIYKARDKNNNNINHRIMGKFRAAIDIAGLEEIKCKNRKFTWSNERASPTLVSIDKFFRN
ncbi:uncharacterized protein [Aegilops tauschii subsp. strangulata]|uniref:uncharacterized protein n=1 Tax=Aegilops tauschii subsp. strangulata TaxID=200361 RepID=UPI003CC869A4